MRKAILLFLLAGLALSAGAADGGEDPTIDDLNLGTWWFGPKVTAPDLAGKVVLVELWGS